MKNLRTIILAAGKGTRMKSDLPKVLHQVCGQPIVDYVLEVSKDVAAEQTYVVLGHQSEQIADHIGTRAVPILQKKLIGTAEAVRSVESSLKNYAGDVLIMCGDTPLLDKTVVKSLIKKHASTKASATVLTAILHDPHGYGRIIRDQSGRMCVIREEKDAVGLEKSIAEINVGVYCFRSKDLFKALSQVTLNAKKKEFYLTDVIEILYNSGKLVETLATDHPEQGLGINTKAHLADIEALMRKRIIGKHLEQGVTVTDAGNTYIYHNVKIGRDTVIRPFTVIEENVKIGKNCVIGPFAHLRPGTSIGNSVEIGNFTELSRSKVGDGSLMKHFSFLGDASIGSQVNIGAGVITANFNGKEKHPTVIGKGAFIGSASVLIAPNKVGKNAVIGAGSVVAAKTNIPDGKTAYGVPAKVKKG